jgi:hypothetical protein
MKKSPFNKRRAEHRLPSCAGRWASRKGPSIAGSNSTAALMPSEVKGLRQLEEEHTRLRKVVAKLTLDKEMLAEDDPRKLWRLLGDAR